MCSSDLEGVGSRLGTWGFWGPSLTLTFLGLLLFGFLHLAAIALMGSTWGLLVAVCVMSAGVGFAYGAMPALIMGSVPISETASANSVTRSTKLVCSSTATMSARGTPTSPASRSPKW